MTDKISELLEQLRKELANTRAVDEKGRELLRNLNADIQSLLNRSDIDETDDSLLERLQDGIDHFEDTYPRLTTTLSSLLTALNNAGI